MGLDLNKQYECLTYIRNQEVTTRWAVNSFFTVLNTAGIVLAVDKLVDISTNLAQNTNDPVEGSQGSLLLIPVLSLTLLIPMAGMASCILWTIVISRIRAWQDHWNECLAKVENHQSSASSVIHVFTNTVEIHKGNAPDIQAASPVPLLLRLFKIRFINTYRVRNAMDLFITSLFVEWAFILFYLLLFLLYVGIDVSKNS